MIVFEDDWTNYPTAIIDINTKNRSWVEYCSLLKSMGVRNIWWPLVLINPELQGLDPRDPNLTKQQMLDVQEECRTNPFYFIREVIRLKSGGGFVNVEANRGNMAALFCFFASLDFAIIMQRQKGKSATLDCIRMWTTYFGIENSTSFLFTESRLLSENIRKIKDSMDDLPRYLDPRTPKDIDNSSELSCVALNNYVRTRIPNSQPERAITVGRGLTPFFTQVDEAPYLTNAHISIPALYAATATERKVFHKKGQPYCNAITTTAGKKDTKEGRYIYKLIHDGMYINEKAIMDAKDVEDAQNIVLKGSIGERAMVNISLSHRQLGISDEEQRRIVADSAPATVDDANRDYYGVWTSGNVSHPLSVKVLASLTAGETDPVETSVTPEGYSFNWYVLQHERFLQEHDVIMGLDVSEAVGRDGNDAIFMDPRTCETIGSCSVTEANLHKYALSMAEFLIRYPRVTMIVEAKSTGRSFMDTVAVKLIEAGVNPFRRMYSRFVDDYIQNADKLKILGKFDQYHALSHYDQHKRWFGFMTTGTSRKVLYETVLIEAAESSIHLAKDKRLAYQIKGLERINGRTDHAPGEHDDSVVAWLLCHWFVRHSKNLGFYGINTDRVLSLVDSKGALLNERELKELAMLEELNEGILLLKDKLTTAISPIESIGYQKRLKVLIDKAEQLGSTTYSMDSIMRDVEEKKVSKRSLAENVRKHARQRQLNRFYTAA